MRSSPTIGLSRCNSRCCSPRRSSEEEPTNADDSNAVAVISIYGQVGYLPRPVAAMVCTLVGLATRPVDRSNATSPAISQVVVAVRHSSALTPPHSRGWDDELRETDFSCLSPSRGQDRLAGRNLLRQLRSTPAVSLPELMTSFGRVLRSDELMYAALKGYAADF